MIPKAYIQSNFFNKIGSNTMDDLKTKIDISDAIKQSNSHVIIDASEDDINNDPFLKVIIKQCNYDKCSKDYIDKTIDSLKSSNNSEDLCATYFLDKTQKECETIEKKYGIVAFCSISFPQKNYLFKGEAIELEKNILYKQRYMFFKDKLRIPCNSLIIIDPYLLVKNANISNNLEYLLDAILPEKLDIDFHITIISMCNTNNQLEGNEETYKLVKECLTKIRKDLNIKFGFCNTTNDKGFHSRHIISNNYIIDSENGFDLFNNKGKISKNNTTISIVFPRLVGDHRKDMTKYINWIKDTKKHINKHQDEPYSCGESENRLFDLTT